MGPHESLSRGGELTHLGIIDRVGKTRKSVCADKCKTCEGVAVLCSRHPPTSESPNSSGTSPLR